MLLKHSFITVVVLFILTLTAAGSAQDNGSMISAIQENRARIETLEETVRGLKKEIRMLRGQVEALQGGGTSQPVDPLVGTWDCTNNVFNYTVIFEPNGNLIQQEQTFGNARDTTWSRVNDQEVAFTGGRRLKTDFHSEDSVTILDVHQKVSYECYRQY